MEQNFMGRGLIFSVIIINLWFVITCISKCWIYIAPFHNMQTLLTIILFYYSVRHQRLPQERSNGKMSTNKCRAIQNYTWACFKWPKNTQYNNNAKHVNIWLGVQYPLKVIPLTCARTDAWAKLITGSGFAAFILHSASHTLFYINLR